MKKRIVILGPLGQDGNLLTSILDGNNFDIWGICKNDTQDQKIQFFEEKHSMKIIKSDFTEYSNVENVLSNIQPNVIVNFAGLSNVFDPWYSTDQVYKQNCQLPLNILNFISKQNPNIFFIQSSSSLMYGNSEISEINEKSTLRPLYPYGISKAYVHNYIQEFRSKFNIKSSSLIFFNHESSYRNENFLSKKVAKFVANILKGNKGKLELGNLSAIKDISHALDFMEGVKIIIDNELNDDFVFSSGNQIKTYDFVNMFFSKFDLEMSKYVKYVSDNREEKLNIFGNNTKLKNIGWNPKYNLDKLVEEMVKFELWK